MRVCVFGAGAVGGTLAAHLIHAGVDVTVVARGSALQSIREHGLCMTMKSPDGQVTRTFVARPKLCLAPTETGSVAEGYDLIILSVKAHSVVSALPAILPLLRPQTILLTLQNGLPWWWLRGHPQHDKVILHSVESDGQLTAAIPLANIVGGVLYVTARTGASPHDLVHTQSHDVIIIGEPSNELTPRLAALQTLLQKTPFAIKCSTSIRDDYFNKLWGNSAMNPISALTCATMGQVLDHAEPLLRSAMAEAMRVGEHFGVKWRFTLDERIATIRSAASHKTSMLQDIEGGREPEIGPIVAVIGEMGRIAGIPTPLNDALLALISLRAKNVANKGC